MNKNLLPITYDEMIKVGFDQPDFVVVGGDAYVDHPSFGTAVIARIVDALGFNVCVLPQPKFNNCEDFKRFGKPKYGFLIGSGNVD
ncbi:MAG: YgiQ family radical SAM protein, partial [Oscillospiraceae bacterium]|nr:YgiQ family radical SAM protein [Oscillospiraceae bacterium]